MFAPKTVHQSSSEKVLILSFAGVCNSFRRAGKFSLCSTEHPATAHKLPPSKCYQCSSCSLSRSTARRRSRPSVRPSTENRNWQFICACNKNCTCQLRSSNEGAVLAGETLWRRGDSRSVRPCQAMGGRPSQMDDTKGGCLRHNSLYQRNKSDLLFQFRVI